MSGRSQKIPFSFFLISLAGGDLSELEGKKGRGSGFNRPLAWGLWERCIMGRTVEQPVYI